MTSEKDIKETLQSIVDEGKRYINLNGEYLRINTAERLTKVLSSLIIALVIAIAGFVVFIFGGLALVHYAGSLTGNLALCFALYALFVCFLLVLFWMGRNALIIRPLAKMMSEALLDECTDDFEIKRTQTRTKLHESQQNLQSAASNLTSSDTTNNSSRLFQFAERGLMIYRGIRLGIRIGQGLNGIFRGKRRKS